MKQEFILNVYITLNLFAYKDYVIENLLIYLFILKVKVKTAPMALKFALCCQKVFKAFMVS